MRKSRPLFWTAQAKERWHLRCCDARNYETWCTSGCIIAKRQDSLTTRWHAMKHQIATRNDGLNLSWENGAVCSLDERKHFKGDKLRPQKQGNRDDGRADPTNEDVLWNILVPRRRQEMWFPRA